MKYKEIEDMFNLLDALHLLWRLRNAQENTFVEIGNQNLKYENQNLKDENQRLETEKKELEWYCFMFLILCLILMFMFMVK